MSEWKPKPKVDAKTEDMNLTGEEGFVLSRLDGTTSVASLVHVTGLPEGRVKQILKKLVRQGAVEESAPTPEPAPAPAPAARKPTRSEVQSTIVNELSAAELASLLDDMSGDHSVDDDVDRTVDDVKPVVLTEDHEEAKPAEEVQLDAQEPPPADDAPAPAADEEQPADEKAEDAASESEEANHRKLYNTELAKLEQPEREAMAKSAKDPYLAALCFDPHPAVIKHVFENQSAGLHHARLVARNHHTPQGLDVVIHRAEFFRDTQTQRLLLQNTMLQEPQLKRILQSKRLAEVYKVTISREIPERNRQKARNVMRSKWSTSDGEERAGLVFTTEGRCLIQLTGLPFDSQTTTLLCQKTYTSLLLIQNLARFGASPPQLLAHLLKQPPVRRQPHLRTLITQHPNCPADAKRRA